MDFKYPTPPKHHIRHPPTTAWRFDIERDDLLKTLPDYGVCAIISAPPILTRRKN